MSRKGFLRIGIPVLATSLALIPAAAAQDQAAQPPAQSSTSDAQVEANVLRALANAPELSTQNIQSSTVYGTVTLTGNVHDEAMRTKAENLVARASGVKKVVDELTLGDTPADQASADQGAAPSQGGQPQSDGNYAPAPPASEQAENTAPPVQSQDQTYAGQPQPQNGYPQQSQPAYPQQQSPQQQPQQGNQYPGGYGPPQDQGQQSNQQGGYGPPQGQAQQQSPYGQPQNNPQYQGGYGPPQTQAQQQPYGQPQAQAQQQPYGSPQGSAQYPGGYGPPQGQYPEQNQQQAYGPPPRQPLYSNNGPSPAYAPPGGQLAGVEVTVPAGAMLRIRINRGLDSNHIKPGTPFDGTVLNDVPADGAIAIPRGATVQGTVIDAQKAGALSGRGELSLQIDSVTLGGFAYPLNTELWAQQGRDKSATTVNSAIGLGALGAIFGAVAGGGAGAAIGAAAGGAVGVAGAASSPGGRVIIPPEAVITFRLAQPAVVKTVSEQEMARMAYAAGPNPQQPPMRRYYSPNYGYYYAPYYGR
ncbi:MAG TPA: BON domain-containing protein [Acidobacteriaceae bacterium]